MSKSSDYSIKTRAKTFYFASFFFNKEIKQEISTLYIFCRYIDDISDSGKLSRVTYIIYVSTKNIKGTDFLFYFFIKEE